jgi:hypothetical protein
MTEIESKIETLASKNIFYFSCEEKRSIFPWEWKEVFRSKLHDFSTKFLLEFCDSSQGWVFLIWWCNTEKVVFLTSSPLSLTDRFPLEKIRRHIFTIRLNWWGRTIVVDGRISQVDENPSSDNFPFKWSKKESSRTLRRKDLEKYFIVVSTILREPVS